MIIVISFPGIRAEYLSKVWQVALWFRFIIHMRSIRWNFEKKYWHLSRCYALSMILFLNIFTVMVNNTVDNTFNTLFVFSH